jgi:hypothetical protein
MTRRGLWLLMQNLLEQHLYRLWPGTRQMLHRLTHPLLVMSAWALRPLMQNQVARHQYRLWPRLLQLPVLVEPKLPPSMAVQVLDCLGPEQAVLPLAGQRQLLRSWMKPRPVEQPLYRS